jgi:hypothetical protein
MEGSMVKLRFNGIVYYWWEIRFSLYFFRSTEGMEGARRTQWLISRKAVDLTQGKRWHAKAQSTQREKDI